MKTNYYILSLIFLLSLGASSFLHGQSTRDLERKRTSVSSQIQKANNELYKTRSAQKHTKAELAYLQKKIGSHEASITTLAEHVDSINHEIDGKITVVEKLEKDLDLLKANYKKIIRQLYRYRLQKNMLSFILSSDSYNEAFQRLIYLQHLEKHRTSQAKAIKKAQEDLAKYVNTLEAQKSETNSFLNDKLTEKEALEQKKSSKAQKINTLQKQELRLRSDLKRKKRYKLQLSKKIEGIIKEQIAKARREARRQQQAQKKKGTVVTSTKNTPPKPDPSLIGTTAFARQKGLLMSPVYQGKVVAHFGKRQHPQFKDVYINNNGIDIKGQYNSVVRSVYSGVVVSIFAIPGMNNAIMIKHGDYFTTYSNISTIYIKQGQKVKKGAQLGTIGKGNQGEGHVMHFELWHGKQKENPSKWLK